MTTATTDYWRTRAKTYGPGWCAHYWDSWMAPHRLALAEVVESLGACDSIFEVGCHCGPNLRLLRSRLPNAWLTGVDISAEAIVYGRDKFDGDKHVRLALGELPHGLLVVPPKWYDVVFSCYALTYLAPAEAVVAVSHMLRIASMAVLIAEPATPDADAPAPEYAHDYAEWVRTLEPSARVRTVTLPSADNLDRVLIVECA